MGRGRIPFAFISVLTFGAFLLFQPFAASREFRREVTCYSDILHLDCGKSIVAIHEAYFTTAKQENQTCHSPVPEHDYIEDEDTDAEPANDSICYEDIRLTLNRKCSGFKSCNYSYSQLPEKNCYSPEGLFIVRFDCVRETNVNKYCNSKLSSPEGYIASPGYPQYYPQLQSCSWTVSASEGQTILASLLHLHVREATDVMPSAQSELEEFHHAMGQLTEQPQKRCDDDRLTVLEGTVRRLEVCGEGGVVELRRVEVDGLAGLEVRLRTVEFMPASGFLAYYKIQGCPTLAAGEDSYLVERNGSAAVYACRNHQVFNDSLEGTRFLKCVRDHHWNDTLPPCISLEETTSTASTTVATIGIEEEFRNLTMAAASEKMDPLFDTKAGLITDIIIPSVIIGVLLIVNGLVLVVIFIIRRRQKPIADEFEEFREQSIAPKGTTEESPQISPRESESQITVSKEIPKQSPQASPKESESQPIVSKEIPEQSPQTSFKESELQPTLSKEIPKQSPQSSPKESESQPIVSKEIPEQSPQTSLKESKSQPMDMQETKAD